MRFEDDFGYDVTLSNAAALPHWAATVHAFIAHSATTADHLAATLKADDSFAMAHVAKGFFMLLLGRRELLSVAEDAERTAARFMQNGATEREHAYLGALTRYAAGDLTGAAHLMDQTLQRWPHDTLALKLVQAIRFVLGDKAGDAQFD